MLNEITGRLNTEESREFIERQYERDKRLFGEREALEFARFRAAALADAEAEETAALKRRLQTALSAAAYAAFLAFAIGFIAGRLF